MSSPDLPSGPEPASSSGRVWLVLALLLLPIGLAAGAYFAWSRTKLPPVPPIQADMEGAMAANLRGVGHMEAHKFPDAEKEFAEAVRLAPNWTPAQINLGIAMFNQQPADNKTLTEHVEKSKDIFREVLKREPNHPHAHYCLGVLDEYSAQSAGAYEHFVAVSKVDPNNAHTWVRVGLNHPDGSTSPAARECYERAHKLDPYLNEANYRLAMSIAAIDPARQTVLLKEFEQLRVGEVVFTPSSTKYTEMGKYADVIGRDPALGGQPAIGPLPLFAPVANFKVTLAEGAKWVTAANLDALRKAARTRFGATIVLFDYNADGRPDVFLTSAVVEKNGKVRDLLLRNDGDGAFTDVTAAAGLATPRPSLGAAAGDFNNDAKPDLVVTGAGEQHLFRNKGDGTFEDVSAATGLDKVAGTCLGCGWLDLDQDGDLDLVLCQFAAGDAGSFDGPKPGGGVVLFENVGVPPAGMTNDPPQISTAFRRNDKFAALVPAGAYTNIVATDIDNDRDVDLLLLAEGGDPVLIENDRLMRFKSAVPPRLAQHAHKWNGGLVLDVNHDERSDLFLVRAGAAPVLKLSEGDRDFAPGTTNSPALKQAVAADIDMDGWMDVVGLTDDGKPVLLHNRGDGRLSAVQNAFGLLAGAQALAVTDLDGDGAPDLLLWTEAGLQLHRNLGNGNRAVVIAPTGRRSFGPTNIQRTNSDGIGTWIVVQSGTHWTGAERTTVASGLGQSLVPTALGIGKRNRADILRVRWPDAVIQAELGIAAGEVYKLIEYNRKGTSCPVLLTWDGERFVFVTDFLGAGSMGESGPDGSTRPPRGEESVKIEPGQLVPKDGQYVLKIGEPMDEVLYLDHLRLAVVDHPADAHVFPDERFASSGPDPSQKLLGFRTRHFPKAATDHRGRDVTKLVLDRDRRAVDTFATRSWLGYAEDHDLTLEFPELPVGGKWYMVLAGWTEYPYPESIFAATRAGIDLKEPKLEKFNPANGTWEPVCDLGFPAGLPRVMTRELPGLTGGKFRISTNMQVYWDQIYLAQAEDAHAVGKVTTLGVARADVAARGFMQEIHPDGRPPVAYDYAKTEPVAVTPWRGKLTRLGEVTELLCAADDRFVLCGPGDEITVRFDARELPALPKGWVRSFVLRTRGYCKDASLTTATGGSVGPLPFRAMPNYPDFGPAKPPVTDADKWHTRPAGGR